VECDDGLRFKAMDSIPDFSSRNGRYFIQTGKLNRERKYRLKIDTFPHLCWASNNNREIKVCSAEYTVFSRIFDILTEIQPSNRKLEALYRIKVRQNAISKRAYDYFVNIKKNSDQTGSLFAPVPSELRGNILCTTDADKPVIGYVDVSTTARSHLYFIMQMKSIVWM